jgi:hypothetical protein
MGFLKLPLRSALQTGPRVAHALGVDKTGQSIHKEVLDDEAKIDDGRFPSLVVSLSLLACAMPQRVLSAIG